MPFRSRSNRRSHALGLASRSLFLPRAMGMGDTAYKKLGELRRQIGRAGCATPPKGSHLDIGFVMITRIRKLLWRGLARAERFVEPRSELSDQEADQHDLDQETRDLW